jgi:hypothetical protein
MPDRHEQQPSKQELAALELYHQLVNLSPDNGDIALRLTLRLPNGAYVGDVLLSSGDVEALADASLGMSLVREAAAAAGPLPLDDDTTDLDEAITALEKFANGGE